MCTWVSQSIYISKKPHCLGRVSRTQRLPKKDDYDLQYNPKTPIEACLRATCQGAKDEFVL